MPNMVLRSFQVFGANDEILDAAVTEIKAAVKTAKASGKVQVVSLLRKGYRHDLQVGDVYVVPASVCDSMEDFPRALLLSKIRQHATPEGQIEFEMGALVDKDDMSKETLNAFKDVVFREGGEGDLKPLLVFRACWSSPYDAIGFLYDEKTVRGQLREVAYAAPFNPALSSVLDALKSVSENHAAFVVSAPVTQHMFHIPDSEEQDYPEFTPGLDYAPAEEDGRTKKGKTASTVEPRRPVIRITAANIPAVEKEMLSDDEMQLFASMDQEVGSTVISSEESGLRESPLSGLITAAVDPSLQQAQQLQLRQVKQQQQLQQRQVQQQQAQAPSPVPQVPPPAAATASVSGTVTPIDSFGKGDGVASTLSQAVSGVGTAPGAVTPSKFAGMVLASPADPLTGTDNPQTDAERTASAVQAGVGEAHQVDDWDKVYGRPEDKTTSGDTTTQTGTVLDVRHPDQHIDNDQSNGSDTPNSDGGGQSMGDMGGGTVTAAKQAGISAETVRAVRRFTENFGGHYLPLKALQEELSRLTNDVKGAVSFMNMEGLIQPYGQGVKVLNKDLQGDQGPRQASYVIKNASGQVWACADVAGVKMGGYWTTDASQEAHDFKNEAEAHEEVRRNCLDREGAIVMPKGIGPLKLAAWWSPGRIIASLYPELSPAPSSHVPGRKASGKHKPKRASSWYDQGTVADEFAPDLVNNNAPNFQGELGQKEGDYINPFGAPGNGVAQAPVSLSGTPEGLNQEFDGVPLKQDANFYGPEFMREFYAPDVDIDAITVKHQASLKGKKAGFVKGGLCPKCKKNETGKFDGEQLFCDDCINKDAVWPIKNKQQEKGKGKKAEVDPRDGEGGAMIKAFRFDNPRPYQGEIDNRSAALVEVDQLKQNPAIKQIEVFILWGGQWSRTNRWERSAPDAEWDEQAQHEMYRTSSLKQANGPAVEGMAYCDACDSAYPKGTQHTCPGGKTAASTRTGAGDTEITYQHFCNLGALNNSHCFSRYDEKLGKHRYYYSGNLSESGWMGWNHKSPGGATPQTPVQAAKTAAPGDPQAPRPGATPPPPKKAPGFLDALNMAPPEDEPKVPYIDPQQNGDGIDNPSPAYLMMDKLIKGCMGAYVAQLIGAFQFTQKPLELETPFEDKLDLQEVMAAGGASSPTAQNAAAQQLTHALELLSDDERKQIVNDGFAQGAVWCESAAGAGGYTYEVFARVEALEGPVLTVRVVTGIR